MGENLKALACTSRHGSCCPHISSCYRTPGLGALATALCQAPKLGVYLGCSLPGPPRGFLSPFISCSRACTLKGEVGRSHVETSPPWLDLRTPGGCLSARNSSRQGFSPHDSSGAGTDPSGGSPVCSASVSLPEITSPSRVLPHQPVPQARARSSLPGLRRPPRLSSVPRNTRGAPNVFVWF